MSDTTSFNQVHLRGRVSREPSIRVMPSGDEVVVFNVVVKRDAIAKRNSKQPVDTIECAVWTKKNSKHARSLRPGAVVEINGALRRRFSRHVGGLQSFVSVEVRDLDVVAAG